MNPEFFRLLYDYDAWANHRVLDACAALTEEQFTRDMRSSFRSVRDTLAHIMEGEWFWLQRWHGDSPRGLPSAAQFPHLASVRARWAEVEAELLQFVGTRTPEDLARVHHYQTTEGFPNSQPLWQMLQHLANHDSYHRGQMTSLLRQLSAAPVALDLILYYREVQAKPPNAAIGPESIRLLYEYNAWANRRVLDSCATLTGEQFARDMGSSFRSVRDTLAHILGAEWAWLGRWQERSPGATPVAEQFRTLAELRARWTENESQLHAFVAGLTAEELARVHEYRTTKSGTFRNPLWQTMQHLVNHGAYHRGQVATLLRQQGAKPASSDLIYFYRERAGQALD